MVCRFRRDGRILFVNGAYARARGTTPDALIGRSFWEFVPETDRPAVEAMLDSLSPKAPEIYIENRFVTATGERWTLWANRALAFDASGRVLEAQSSGIDITARRQAEQALRDKEERLRLATSAGRVGVWDWDVLQDVVSWSETLYALHGVVRGTSGSSAAEFTALVHEEDRAHFSEKLRSALGGDEAFDVEHRVVRPDGAVLWIYTQAKVLRDARGKPLRVVGAAVDITARKETEAALRRRVTELQTINRLSAAVVRAVDVEQILTAAMEGLIDVLEADRAAVLLFDEDGVMRFRAWRGLSEDYRRAVEGHSPWQPDDGDAQPIVITDAANDTAIGPLREAILREGLRALAFVPLVSCGRVIGKFMVYHDLPHTFSAQELQVCQTIAGHVAYALERARAEHALREADRRKDLFLATLGHELRNPLAPLANMLQILEKDGLEGDVRARGLEVMDRQVRHLVRLVDDLVDMSRISRGKIELRRERIDLRALVQATVDDTRSRSSAKDQTITLVVGNGPLEIEGDVTRVTQIFENLLNNACKFTPRGGCIDVEVDRDRAAAVLRVRDTGIGIAAEDLTRIFDLFSQVEEPLQRSQGGLGIGLALVRDLVALHGGTIEASSAGIGCGSEFTVRLPLATGPSDAVVIPTETRPAGAIPRRRILVVDDNRDAAESLVMLLEPQGHEVQTAFDGLEAVAVANGFRPDVILLDIGLPTLNGYEVAGRIRRSQGEHRPLLIALTGWGQAEDRRRSREAGFDAHLVKPLDPDALHRLLDGHSPPDRARESGPRHPAAPA